MGWDNGKNGEVDNERRQLKCGFERAIGLIDLRNKVAMVWRLWTEVLDVGGIAVARYYSKLYHLDIISVLSCILKICRRE